MKTKQLYMKAVFTKQCENGKNLFERNNTPDHRYMLIDKKTERTIVSCDVGTKGNGTTVYASIWVHTMKTTPAGFEYPSTAGNGSAGGCGYHKYSAAIASAISSAGIELYGSPYGKPVNQETPAETRKLLKKRAFIGGCGDGSIRVALCAIAYAAGYTDCIFVG